MGLGLQGSERGGRIEEERGMYERLLLLDPRRQGFYEDQLKALRDAQ